jgi:hypothetical protein
MPVAQELLNTTDRAFKLVVSDSRFLGLLRTQVIARIGAFAMHFERTQRRAFRVVSQTGITYRHSSLSRSPPAFPKHGPQPGDRFPWLKLKLRADSAAADLFEELDDTRFNLLMFGQPSLGDREFDLDTLSVHRVPFDPVNEAALNAADIPRPSFYLLRPDGHVGLCGSAYSAAACERYFADSLRIGGGQA